MALFLTYKSVQRLYLRNQKAFIRFSSDSCSKKNGLILGCYYDKECGIQLTSAAEKFNEITCGKLIDNIKLAGDKIKKGKSLLFWGLNESYPAVTVVGLGKKSEECDELEIISQKEENVRIAAAVGCHALSNVEINHIHVENFDHNAEAAAEGSGLATWKFQPYKMKKQDLPEISLACFENSSVDDNDWSDGIIKANSQNVARRLADTPANLMTPSIFAQTVSCIFKSFPDVKVVAHDAEWAKSEYMEAFLAVAQGSKQKPKFLEITYGEEKDPFVLIGKGVTFDAGGISLKPASNMDHMRADMGGAACVIGTIFGLSSLKVEANIKILIPLVENMPSGSAVKPGDVIYARNGKSICVDNTDAEGRLILADALCYSEKFKPKWVLDIATLTGAMQVTLGNAATGVFTNSSIQYQNLEKAGSYTGDRVWRLPLWKHFTKQIAENTAYDLNNIGKGKGGGSCTAAAFLREFVPAKTDWLHLDIAGVMGPDDTVPYLSKGMTGRPTRTLIQFIKNQCN